MKGKKFLPILVLVLVVALGAMGVGYAAWTQNLVVEGTLSTGYFSVYWTAPQAAETEVGGGNYASCSTWLSDASKRLNISIGNAYPGYQCVVTAKVHNSGTVPAVPASGYTHDGSIPNWILSSTQDFAPGNGEGHTGPILPGTERDEFQATLLVDPDEDIPQTTSFWGTATFTLNSQVPTP